MQEELNEFEQLKVWKLVPRPDKVMIITLKWIYKVKLDELEGILKNKARLIFLTYAAHKNIAVYQMDVKTASLNGNLREEVYKYGFESCDPVDTSVVEKSKLDEDKKGKAVDLSHYRGMIGTLLYLTASRPDIQFAICMCARPDLQFAKCMCAWYQARPTEKHLHAVKRIFRYLPGTVNRDLWYPKDSLIALRAFEDADHASCQDTRRSTSGSMQFLRDRLTSWSSKRQKSAAISNVYVSQPDGFVDPNNPNHVYKLKKALYGLKQAPCAWYDMLSSFLISQDFSKGLVNPTPFIRRNGNDLLLSRPTEKHLHAVKRIFRFLPGTVNRDLWYPKDSLIALRAFEDADHAGCQDTRRSTSGSMQFLRDRLTRWSSKRQKSAAISSTKAEYIALSGCCAQILWMRS
nr:uncharacterized mitochondrial protein AtMg00810-like [Tanacetum cinerariifolium]